MGDALGNVTPFGVLVSEPSKVAFVRRHVGIAPAISAVTIENLFYIASVVIVFLGGAGALLLSFDAGQDRYSPDQQQRASKQENRWMELNCPAEALLVDHVNQDQRKRHPEG